MRNDVRFVLSCPNHDIIDVLFSAPQKCVVILNRLVIVTCAIRFVHCK